MQHVTPVRPDVLAAACAGHPDAPALLAEDTACPYRQLGSTASGEAARLTPRDRGRTD